MRYSVLLLMVIMAGCTTFEFDNPLDPRGIFHTGNGGKTDTIPPVVRLTGPESLTVALGGVFLDPGATASDETDGNLSNAIIVSGVVNTAVEDVYRITYTAFDRTGNSGSATRIVTVRFVEDTIPPKITVNGSNPMTVYKGSTYYELGATAIDEVSGDVSASVVISGSVNTDVVGAYTITYTAKDEKGNSSSATRTVNVREREAGQADTVRPVITLKGKSPLTVAVGGTYAEPGATAIDDVDGDISDRIVISGTVNTGREGTYQVSYTVSDAAGNQALATRIVIVGTVSQDKDTIAPVLTLLGDNPMRLILGQTYQEPGATAMDNKDGNLTGSIVVSGTVNTSTAGTYTVTYTVEDLSGNRTVRTRTVTVAAPVSADTVKPVITLNGQASMQVTVGTAWQDPGATAVDNVDGNLTSAIVVTGTVNTAAAGTYTLTYTVSDKAGNTAGVTRMVTVTASGSSDLLTKYGAPSAQPIPTLPPEYKTITFDGTAPDGVKTITSVQLQWNAEAKQIYYAGVGLSVAPHHQGIASAIAHTLDRPQPKITITGSGITGFDGEYHMVLSNDRLIWVRTDGSFAIICAL